MIRAEPGSLSEDEALYGLGSGCLAALSPQGLWFPTLSASSSHETAAGEKADVHTGGHTRPDCAAFRGSGAPDVLGFLFSASTAGRVCGCGLSVSGSCERQKLG